MASKHNKHDNDSDDDGHDDPELEAEMNRIMGRTGGQKRSEPSLSLLQRAQLAQQRRLVGGAGAAVAQAPARTGGGILAGIQLPAKKKRHDRKEKKGDDSSDSEDDEEEPDEKEKERLAYLASLNQLQRELKDGKSTPQLASDSLTSRKGSTPPPQADDIPIAPPMDDEIPAPPPMEEEIPVAPPLDDDEGIPAAPPLDDEEGIPTAPPMDEEIPAPPPMDEDDDEVPTAPPMDADDEVPVAPPMDDDDAPQHKFQLGSVNCEFCEDVHLATHRCLECEQNTCEHLSKLHLKARATATHHIIPLEQSKLPLCKTHSLPLSLIDVVSQQPVCTTCATTTHKGHKTESLKDWTAKKRQLLSLMVEKAEMLIKKWTSSKENGKVTKEELKNGEIMLEIKISGFFEKAQKALHDKHQAILNEAKRLTKEKLSMVDARQDAIQKQINSLTRIKDEIRDSLSDSKTPKLSDLENILIQALEATQHTPAVDERSILFFVDEQTYMQNIGQIHLQQGTVAKATAMTATVHKPATTAVAPAPAPAPVPVPVKATPHVTPASPSHHTSAASHSATPVSPKSSTLASSSAVSTSTAAKSTTSTPAVDKKAAAPAATPAAPAAASGDKFATDYVSKLGWDKLCKSKSEELSIAMPFADTKEGAGIATGSLDNGKFWAYYTHDLQKNGNSRLWVADLKSGSTNAINLPFNIENTYPVYDGKEWLYLFEDARYGFGRVNVTTFEFENLDETRHPVEPQCSACFQDGLLWRIQNRSLVSWDPKTQKWSSVHAILNNKMLMFADPFRRDRIWMLNNKGDFLSFDTQKSSLSRISTTRYEQIVEGTFAGILFPLENKEIAIATQWGNGPWQLHNLTTKVWVDLDWPKVHDGGHASYNEHRKEIIYQAENHKNLYRVAL